MATPETIHGEMTSALLRRDFDAIRELLHPEYTYTGGDGQVVTGPDAGVAVAQMYLAAFPDMRPEIRSTITQGNTAVTEFQVRATHQGDLMGVSPTGKPIDVTVCNIVELKDGRIYREREYFDSMALWSQLGVVKAPGS